MSTKSDHFRNILVSVDGSNRDQYVARQALHLAQQHQSKLTFLRIVEPVPEQIGWLAEGFPPPIDLQQVRHEQAKTELNGLMTQLSLSSDDVRLLVKEGQPAIAVIREVIKNRHDLVVRAGDASHPFASSIFGNTCRHLIRKCPCPVLGVKPVSEHQYQRILAAISIPHNTHDYLNEKILKKASQLAMREEAELHVAHIWRPDIMPNLPSWSKDKKIEVKDWLKETEARHKDWFYKTIEPYGFSKNDERAHFLSGEPGLSLAELVVSLHADIIVMGTVARTGIKGFLMGNTAERVLEDIKCSVLALKPDGFISPIE